MDISNGNFIFAHRKTRHTETWAYGGCEDYYLETNDELYMGDNIDDMKKFCTSFIVNTLVQWYQKGRRNGFEKLSYDYWKDEIIFCISPIFRGGCKFICDADGCIVSDPYNAIPEKISVPECFEAAFAKFENIRIEIDKQREREKELAESHQKLLARDARLKEYERLRAEFDTWSSVKKELP